MLRLFNSTQNQLMRQANSGLNFVLECSVSVLYNTSPMKILMGLVTLFFTVQSGIQRYAYVQHSCFLLLETEVEELINVCRCDENRRLDDVL